MAQYHTGNKVSGYLTITDPGLPGGKVELETRMCGHCGWHGLYSPGNAKQYLKYMAGKNFINGICMHCMSLVCMKKKCNERCMPIEKMLEIEEKDSRFLIS